MSNLGGGNPPLDFTAVPVKRGRITNARTTEYMEFSLNPTSIKAGVGSNLANDNIPGGSDPLLRWMSGKGRTISFDLQLDGDITLRVMGNQMANGANQDAYVPATWGSGKGTPVGATFSSYSVVGAMAFLDQFCFPVNPDEDGSDFDGSRGGPDRFIFTFGSYFRQVVCIMKDVSHEIEEFDPDLNPTKCKSSITFARYITDTQWASDVWSPAGRT